MMMIFFSGCKAAPDMSFGLVDVENGLDLSGKGRADFVESFCYIFMYGAFADFEFLSGGSDGGVCGDNIISQCQHSLFNVILHMIYRSFNSC